MRILFAVILAVLFAGFNAAAQDDKTIRLAAPSDLVESGLLKYMLPRFSLKTQVRIELVSPGDPAEAELGDHGTSVFVGEGRTWGLTLHAPDHPGAAKFLAWITSEVGQRAITGFKRDGTQVFNLPTAETTVVEEVVFEGDADLGRKLSRVHCGRCHVTARSAGMIGIGSTPSFFVLRGLEDWDIRFSAFFSLKPHPAFTQIEDVTDPFPIDRPSPIHPVVLTLDQLDAILAYVEKIEPADLGAPLKSQ